MKISEDDPLFPAGSLQPPRRRRAGVTVLALRGANEQIAREVSFTSRAVCAVCCFHFGFHFVVGSCLHITHECLLKQHLIFFCCCLLPVVNFCHSFVTSPGQSKQSVSQLCKHMHMVREAAKDAPRQCVCSPLR